MLFVDMQGAQEFVTLARIRNFARAADELFTTQATLSRHIAQLEKELGKPLFNRTTRRVELTEFGAEFLPYAKRLLQAYEECQNWLAADAKAEKDRLIVALAAPLYTDVNMQQLFIKFSLDNPAYNIELIQSDDEETLLERLRRRECDVVVAREPLGISDSFQRLPIRPVEPLCIVLPNTHPFAGRDTVTLDLLKDEIFYLPPIASYTYKLFLERCHQSGFNPKIRNSLRGRDFALGIAKTGAGIPVLSKLPAMDFSADPESTDGPVVTVEIAPPICQQISIVYPSMKTVPAATMQLINYFKTNVPLSE